MKVISYLAFTMLSVAIQFVVMDFIQTQMKVDEDDTRNIDLNNTSPKKTFSDILLHYTPKAHALYYKSANIAENNSKSTQVENSSEPSKGEHSSKPPKTSSSSLIPDMTTTDISSNSNLVDLLYDDNITSTEDFYSTTTESFYTSTEFDNITEITFFGNKNMTRIVPKTTPKSTASKYCNCNLLYKVCDINCCCDDDCTSEERKVFVCGEMALHKELNDSCFSQFSPPMGSKIDDLFCVVKNNLPEKRKILDIKHDPSVIGKQFKWHSHSIFKDVHEFTKKLYKYGDPIWLLRNDTVYYIDLPTSTINNYCSGRKPLRFLKEEKIKCNVVLTDLEIFQILSTAEQTSVISVAGNLNSSFMNCSTLHCTNWTIILCDGITCTNYNKSLHNPLCTDNICTDLAIKVAYIFHYYENKIMNATIKLYIHKLPVNMPFIEQKITVKFVIANVSTAKIVEYSGNPGYITGRPIIVSFAEKNYTETFYNNTVKLKKYLIYPDNKNGVCGRTNMSNNFVLFRTNKRVKCRYIHEQRHPLRNETDTCRNIQKNITKLVGYRQKIVVSPLGNPNRLKDEDWLWVTNVPEQVIYGELNARKNKLTCYNIATRYSFIFTFADASENPNRNEFKILRVIMEVTTNNITFNKEDLSTVITSDTVFIDESKSSEYEYAGGPQLNIHLPRDFFFPFPANNGRICGISNLILAVLLLLVAKIK